MSEFREYATYDGHGLAELIRRGHVSRAEVLESAIARITANNPRVNAVVRTRYDKARAESPRAEGPFAGVPFLLKDLHVTVSGEITSAGSRFFADALASQDSELTRRYREAGLVILGQTNTPELGMLPVTEPVQFGAAKNPWDTGRTPGGSSGGAAAAVAAGMVPFAHGSDGGGSIRIPAACCGLFGLKPTRGRVPPGPDASERWSGFSQEHVLSRSVRDSAAALDVTAGPGVGAPYWAPPPAGRYVDELELEPGALRIALVVEPALSAGVDRDCLRAARDAAELCESLGHRVVEVAPDHDRRELAAAFLTVIAAHTAADVEAAERARGRRAGAGDLETKTWLAALLGRQLRATDLAAAVRTLQAESRRIADRFDAYDAILSPTLGRVALPHGALHSKGVLGAVERAIIRGGVGPALRLPGVIQRAAESTFSVAAFTPLANFTGRPSMSVPLWWNAEGLPVGAMFTGRFGDEATLFRLAAQLETARPWFHRTAPLAA